MTHDWWRYGAKAARFTEAHHEDTKDFLQAQAMIASLAKAQVEAEHRMVEEACERSLQGGEHGVFVLRDATTGHLVSAEVHRYVPYGNIYVGTLPAEEILPLRDNPETEDFR